MTIKTLYLYKREDGGMTVSPNKPNCEHAELVRLIADEGMVLTDGNIITCCVDVESAEGWTETDAPEEIKLRRGR